MGVNHSHSNDNACGANCNCFIADKCVKQRDVIRYSSSKWIWSQKHDSTLIRSLTDKHYDIPMDIICLIKEHTFSTTHDYHIMTATICSETYYSKTNTLIHKHLCYQWYMSQLSILESFVIALIGQNKKGKQWLYDSFCNHSLPALQSSDLNGSHFQSMRHTLFVDKLQIAVNLLNIDMDDMNICDKIDYAQIYLILFDNEDQMRNIQTLIASNSKQKTYILVRMDDENENVKNAPIVSAQHQLCRHYNIPYIHVSLDSDESIQDLFQFAIKYYWFSMAN